MESIILIAIVVVAGIIYVVNRFGEAVHDELWHAMHDDHPNDYFSRR